MDVTGLSIFSAPALGKRKHKNKMPLRNANPEANFGTREICEGSLSSGQSPAFCENGVATVCLSGGRLRRGRTRMSAGHRIWAHLGLVDCTWRKRGEAKGVTRPNLVMDQCVVNPIAAIAGNDPKPAF
jgi:hypothetical protein